MSSRYNEIKKATAICTVREALWYFPHTLFFRIRKRTL